MHTLIRVCDFVESVDRFLGGAISVVKNKFMFVFRENFGQNRNFLVGTTVPIFHWITIKTLRCFEGSTYLGVAVELDL